MDRTNWEFGKTTIKILMISVIWNGMGVPLIWTLLSSAGNSNTRAWTDIPYRLRETFPDLKIASLMVDREFIGDAWMTYLRARKIRPAASRESACRPRGLRHMDDRRHRAAIGQGSKAGVDSS